MLSSVSLLTALGQIGLSLGKTSGMLLAKFATQWLDLAGQKYLKKPTCLCGTLVCEEQWLKIIGAKSFGCDL